MSKALKTEEKVVVVTVIGATLAGILFFGFGSKIFSDFSKDSDTHPAALTSSAGDQDDKARITELENRIETLKDNSADKKTIAELQSQLNAQEKKAKNNLESSQDEVASLKAQIADLSGSSTPSSRDSSKISALTSELELAEGNREELTTKLSAMSSASQGKTDQLTEQINTLKNDNSKLTTQLSELKSDTAMASVKTTPNVDRDTASKMNQLLETTTAQKAQIANQKTKIVQLSAQVNQFKAAKNIFVESVDDLPENAKNLLADLNTLEGKSEADVQTAYSQYLTKHGATAKKRIKFSSGSSSINANDRNDIAQLTQAADENTYFFIVGYADQSGSAQSNKKLSSARSISVAKELSAKAQGFQSAQAVYLGQTNRFGASAENRVVEIWEIK